jgi:hypothetical protein
MFLVLLYSGVVVAIEEPEYQLESKAEQFEIRVYGDIVIAETKVESDFEEAGNRAFRILAAYIFGDNKSKTKIEMTAPVNQVATSEKIEMTAPVNQVKTSGGYLVQFTMPKKFNLANLPTPNDARVHLRQIPGRRVAVYSYSGSWSEARYQEKLLDFKEELNKANVETKGEPVLARFNSPFQLWFLRRNEIWFDLAKPDTKPKVVELTN